MTEDQALAALSALSNRSRLAVVRHLVAAGPDGATAGDIAAAVGASPSRTSFHLSALASAGLVRSERQARQVLYRVQFTTVGRLLNFLLEDCCKNAPAVRDCCGLGGDHT